LHSDRRARRLRSGRTRELELLANRFNKRPQAGQMVAAAGEPGLAKSRLFDAFPRSSISSAGMSELVVALWKAALAAGDRPSQNLRHQARGGREPFLKVDAGGAVRHLRATGRVARCILAWW
jgi:hypothetical protein